MHRARSRRSKKVVDPQGRGHPARSPRGSSARASSPTGWLFIAGYQMTKLTGWSDGGRPVQPQGRRVSDPAGRQHAPGHRHPGRKARPLTYRVTIPEGLTSHQIVERLKSDPNLTGEIAEVPPEGSLLPETFVVQRGAQRQAIIDTHARRGAQAGREAVGAAPEGPAAQDAGRRRSCWPPSSRRRPGRNDERERWRRSS